MPCLELVYAKNYFSLSDIFVLRLFKMVANQRTPGLIRSLSSKYWWLRSVNHEKFIDECLLRSMFSNELYMCVSLRAWVRKKVHWEETHQLSNHEKVLDAVVSKEGHASLAPGTWKDLSLLISLKKVKM